MAAFREAGGIRRVAAVGAGLIGAGWVAAFLARGFEVSVYDPSPDAAERVGRHIAAVWPQLRTRGLDDRANPEALSFHGTLAAALREADFVQESTPERPEEKIALFREMGGLVPPDVLIASSTSGMPVSSLQEACAHPERCVLGHPFNPVHLMPLVEVGGGKKTAPEAVEAVTGLYLSMGKQPVHVRNEIVGHLANRLTAAMFREAVALVEDGYATIEDIDRAIRFGPALKWAIQGQFTTFHTSGGAGGLENFLRHFGPGIAGRWRTMRVPDLADPALQAELAMQMAAATGGEPVEEIARRQDETLLKLLALLG